MPSREELDVQRRRAEMDAATRDARKRAARTESQYLGRALSFDPGKAVGTWAGGAWGDVRKQLGDDLRDLRGSAVGAGRLDTGFFDEDQGEVITDATAGFNRALAQQSVNVAGLDLRNIEGIGGHANRSQDRYLDLMTGGLDRAEEDLEARRRRGNPWARALGTAAGGVGGFLVAGPAGAAAGARLGYGVAGG